MKWKVAPQVEGLRDLGGHEEVAATTPNISPTHINHNNTSNINTTHLHKNNSTHTQKDNTTYKTRKEYIDAVIMMNSMFENDIDYGPYQWVNDPKIGEDQFHQLLGQTTLKNDSTNHPNPSNNNNSSHFCGTKFKDNEGDLGDDEYTHRPGYTTRTQKLHFYCASQVAVQLSWCHISSVGCHKCIAMINFPAVWLHKSK